MTDWKKSCARVSVYRVLVYYKPENCKQDGPSDAPIPRSFLPPYIICIYIYKREGETKKERRKERKRERSKRERTRKTYTITQRIRQKRETLSKVF